MKKRCNALRLLVFPGARGYSCPDAIPPRGARLLAAALLLSVVRLQGRIDGSPAAAAARGHRGAGRGPGRRRWSSARRWTCAPSSRPTWGSKTLGYLDAVLVDRGDRVRKGQLLALVRPSDLPDQMEAARVAFENAKANKARAEALAPSGVVSQQELQNNQSAFAAAQANLQAISTRLGETRIESPIDGVVSQRRLDPGVLVGPNAGTGAILTVQRSDVLRVFVPVNEKDAPSVGWGRRPAPRSTRCRASATGARWCGSRRPSTRWPAPSTPRCTS